MLVVIERRITAGMPSHDLLLGENKLNLAEQAHATSVSEDSTPRPVSTDAEVPGGHLVYCATETTSESGASECDVVVCTDTADGITATILRVYCGIPGKMNEQTL
jgi:hypothetical protein